MRQIEFTYQKLMYVFEIHYIKIAKQIWNGVNTFYLKDWKNLFKFSNKEYVNLKTTEHGSALRILVSFSKACKTKGI